MKLTKSVEAKLRKDISHITGECMCKPSSKTCTYWKCVEKGGAWQTDEIIKLIKKL